MTNERTKTKAASISKSKRKAKSLRSAQRTNRVVQGTEPAGGLQAVLQVSGQKIPRNGKLEAETSASPVSALVPVPRRLPQIAEERSGAGREISRFYAAVPEAVAVRSASIQAEYQDTTIATKLPPEVASFLDKWLRRNHLMFCACDQQFWDAFAHVLTTVEGFSVEAVEEALRICLVGARQTERRLAVYAELRSVRELRKIRNFSMKLQTSRLLVDRYLVNNADIAKGEEEEANPGTFTAPIEVGSRVIHESVTPDEVDWRYVGTVTKIQDSSVIVRWLNGNEGAFDDGLGVWRHATPDEIKAAESEAAEIAVLKAENAAMSEEEQVRHAAFLTLNSLYVVRYPEPEDEFYATLEKRFKTVAEAEEFIQSLGEQDPELRIEKIIVHEDGGIQHCGMVCEGEDPDLLGRNAG